jgi:transcription initiation factor TFIIB
MGLAGTILYLSCLETGENKTQYDIAQAAGVTEVTLRNRSKDLKNKLELSVSTRYTKCSIITEQTINQ